MSEIFQSNISYGVTGVDLPSREGGREGGRVLKNISLVNQSVGQSVLTVACADRASCRLNTIIYNF